MEEGAPAWWPRSPAPPPCRVCTPASGVAAGPQLACPPCQWARGPGFPGRDGTGAQLPTLTCSVSVLRELQEREKALRLQKERLQRELEEKKRKVTGGWACGSRGLCTELWAGAAWPQWFGQELLCLPGLPPTSAPADFLPVCQPMADLLPAHLPA